MKRLIALFFSFTIIFGSLCLATLAEDMTTPPPKPDGESEQGQTPPEMPQFTPGEGMSGDMGTPPDGASGNMGTPPDGMPGESGAAPGSSSAPTSYEALVTVTEDTDLSGENLQSTATDESAVLVTSGKLTADQLSITRISGDSTGGDAASFYGVGACILATGGEAELSNVSINSAAEGGAGIFAYGNGVITVDGGTIDTTGNASGGIHVSGGGTLHAKNLTIHTTGNHSAPIRSDRGGGTITVEGGSYSSTASDSPAVYVTADISISNAELDAEGAEAVCIEGRNSLLLTDCALVSNMPEDVQNDVTWSVILYQSMSGDSEIGKSVFTMNGGSLSSYSGGLLYTTNTESEITLNNVKLSFPDGGCDFILRCSGNSNARGWGQTGSNGADCDFTAIAQELPGDIVWDNASQLDVNLTEGSILTGAVLQDNSAAGEAEGGSCNVTVDASSTWIVTGDSFVSSLSCDGTLIGADGLSVSLKDSSGNVLSQGEGSYTITIAE